MSREERSFTKDIVDSQTEEKEKEFRVLDQVPNSGKDTNDSLQPVDLGVGREEDDVYAGEKMQCHNSVAKVLLSGRRNNLGFKAQVGRKFIRSPKTSEDKTSGIELDAEGEGYTRVGRRVRLGGEGQGKEDGACPVPSSSVGQSQFQEEVQAGSGQVREAVRGMGSDMVEGGEAEWGQGWQVGLDRTHWGNPSPVFFNRSLLNGPGSLDYNGSKAQEMGMGAGLRQGLCSKDTSTSSCKRLILCTKNDGQKEKSIQSGEDEEFSKDLAQNQSWL